MRTWLDAVIDFAAAHGVPDRVVAALRVYDRGGDRSWAADFVALEGTLDTIVAELVRRIRQELSSEVDPHQAQMFAERFGSVDRLLTDDGSEAARVFRVGLVERVRQILDEGGATRALRVRGAVDYVYSQAALHWHTRGTTAPSLTEWASAAQFREVAGGSFARLEGPTAWGPQHVSVLRIPHGVAELDALDAYTAWGPEQDLPRQVAEAGAVAAFSGGFFLYSEPDLGDPCLRHDPVGLLVRAGAVQLPAVFSRAALVQSANGRVDVRRVGLGDHQLQIGSGSWGRPTRWVNRAVAPRASGVAIVGARVVAVGADVPVPLNGVVVVEVGGRPALGQAGDRVSWRLPGVQTAVSGGPFLARAGEIGVDLPAEDFAGTAPPRTFVDDETGDRNLLPRLAVGIDAEGALIVAAVDGRNAERALGLGLHSLGELMVALGAVRAMNLDGGSSKRMVVDGRIVDLPSVGVQGRGVTVAEVRPLHTVVLVRARG